MTLIADALWLALPQTQGQSNAQIGPLCTSEGTPADKQIGACNKIMALKVFAGEQMATIYSGARSAANRFTLRANLTAGAVTFG